MTDQILRIIICSTFYRSITQMIAAHRNAISRTRCIFYKDFVHITRGASTRALTTSTSNAIHNLQYVVEDYRMKK